MIAAEKLAAVRALLATPDQWCQGAMALDSLGRYTGYTDPESCSFCLVGAIAKVERIDVGMMSYESAKKTDTHRALVQELEASMGESMDDAGFDSLVDFNDHEATGYEQVLALLDRTIAKLEASETPKELT